MLTHDNKSLNSRESGCNPVLLEKRRSMNEFIIRQLEVIEEQTYLLGHDSAGREIFKAIQILENISRASLSEMPDEDTEESDDE